MSAVAFQIAPVPEPLTKGAPQAAAVSGGTAQSAQALGAQPDIVTLASRAAEGQATRGESGNAPFGETTTFFFAERENFRAANGSSASQATNQAPTLPVDTGIGSNGVSTAPGIGQPPAAPDPELDVALNTPGTGGPGLSSLLSNTGAPAPGAQTPQEELAQLDQTLQQIGINPQSISLFSRMAMLLYSNDPAALRNLVETLQQVAQQIGVARQANAPGGVAARALVAGSAAAPAHVESGGNASSGGTIAVAGENASGPTASAEASGGLGSQLVGLQVAFAAIGVKQGSTAGEVLNVTV